MSSCAVTQTGHPGPETSFNSGGKRDFRPKRATAMVWVPHTSMSVAGPGARSCI
jgi:hypothetical protein